MHFVSSSEPDIDGKPANEALQCALYCLYQQTWQVSKKVKEKYYYSNHK